MYDVIVVAVDGSPAGYEAVRVAAELASRVRASLFAISVEEGFPRYSDSVSEVKAFHEDKDSYFAQVGERAKSIAAGEGILLRHVITIGNAADAIVSFASEAEADLIVLGQKEHSRLGQLVSGATAQRVSACVRASVLLVRAPQASAPARG